MSLVMNKRTSVGTLVAFLLSFLLSACITVTPVSDYDEQTDKALTALQQSMDDFVTKLVAKAPSDENAFDKHKKFYEDTDQQLRKLEFRVNLIPKNSHSIKLVANIRASILGEGKCTEEGTSLRDLHCMPDSAAKGPSKDALEISLRNINQTIGAALTLEIAKKQGKEKNK